MLEPPRTFVNGIFRMTTNQEKLTMKIIQKMIWMPKMNLTIFSMLIMMNYNFIDFRFYSSNFLCRRLSNMKSDTNNRDMANAFQGRIIYCLFGYGATQWQTYYHQLKLPNSGETRLFNLLQISHYFKLRFPSCYKTTSKTGSNLGVTPPCGQTSSNHLQIVF